MEAGDESGQVEQRTPAERLRALELSGDPDAREIARGYKSSPLDGGIGATLRQVTRSQRQVMSPFRSSYAGATDDDADEAERRVAAMRARREDERRKWEAELHTFAQAADRREATMLRLTRINVVIALASFAAATAAVIAALTSN